MTICVVTNEMLGTLIVETCTSSPIKLYELLLQYDFSFVCRMTDREKRSVVEDRIQKQYRKK